MHTIATAFKEGTLDRYIVNYSVDLTNLVKQSENAGKKPSRTVQKRKRQQQQCDVSGYHERIQTSTLTFPENKKWTVTFVKSTKMRKCYGCGGTVRYSVDVEPPSPFNIVLKRKEFRVYNQASTHVLKIAPTEENVYYHG